MLKTYGYYLPFVTDINDVIKHVNTKSETDELYNKAKSELTQTELKKVYEEMLEDLDLSIVEDLLDKAFRLALETKIKQKS